MSQNNKHIMMIGLPSTGKTTFLAALWYVVNNIDEVEDALSLVTLEGDKEHLNRIMDQWLEYYPVDRTSPTLQNTVSMELRHTKFSKTAKVYFPDISGEEYRQQVEDRFCNKNYFDWIENSSGALFFINCGNVDRLHTIDMLDKLAGNDEALDGSQQSEEIEPIVYWDSEHISLPARLVELFQIVSSIDGIIKPYPIAIIVSAWDLINIRYDSPQKYIDHTFPLLSQYIESNRDVFNVSYFGISAQGGELEHGNETQRDELAEKSHMSPSSRIIVKTEDNSSTDITIPIKWFMELDNEK